MTTSLEYAPKKVAKSRGFSGTAIIVVGPCKSKIELSVSTSLPEDVIVLVELKSASEARYELKLLEPSVSLLLSKKTSRILIKNEVPESEKFLTSFTYVKIKKNRSSNIFSLLC